MIGSVAMGTAKDDPHDGLIAARRIRLEPRCEIGRKRAPGFLREEGARHRMLRPREDLEDVALLDDASAFDHGDIVGDRADHRHFVRDEQDR